MYEELNASLEISNNAFAVSPRSCGSGSAACVASSAASIVSGIASTAVASAASFAIAAARGRGGGVRPTQNDT